MADEIFKLIKSLGETKFNELVKEYNKCKYDTWDVNIVNGPYDGGIDLVIRINDKEIKKSIQVTVQENLFEKKLEEDLGKAQRNIKEYGYLREMIFFCPYRVTKSKQNELEKNAEINFGISLQITDGWKISEDCEVFNALKVFIYRLHDIDVKQSTDVSKEEKIVFDYLALSKESADFKNNFIHFYILSYLQDHPLSSMDILIEGVHLEIDKNVNNRLIRNQVHNLLTEKKIIKNGDQYSISPDEQLRLENILEKVNFQERLVLSEFNKILSRYNCQGLVKDIFRLIRNIFQVNFGFELNELNHKLSNFESDIKGKFHELENYLQKNLINKADQLEIIRQLIIASGSNEYFSKVSIMSLYVGLFNNNKLNRYILNKELFVCIDTQVLLRYICVKYKRVDTYLDKPYIATKNLIDCISNTENSIHLFTTIDYVNECVSHLWSAIELDRFSKLDYIKKLGPSKNVFYNFYLFLSETSWNFYGSITEFIGDIVGKDISDLNYHQFEQVVGYKLVSMLPLTRLEVKSHSEYKEFAKVKKEYEITLSRCNFKRSYHAITNDVRTAIFLAQEDRFIDSNKVYSEPFLITWDTSFQHLRDVVYRISDLSSWHLYTPLKFIDRICVMNFKVSPENISMNIASLIEEDFTTSSKFVSFFDVISTYFKTSNVSELSIARQLVDLKERTFNVDVIDDFSKERVTYSPLTDLLTEIRHHYRSNVKNHSFDDVISIFEDKNYEDKIIELIKKTITNEQTVDQLVEAFDLIIDKKKTESA